MQHTLKYKLIQAKPISGRFEDFNLNDIPTEGVLMAIDGKNIASAWKAAGGCVSVLDKNKPHRVFKDTPLIRAHRQNINDVRYSPFIPNVLATSSDDATVKLWQIPEEGLTKDMEKEVQIHSDHANKVIQSIFHPCSGDIIASMSHDKTIDVWSVVNGKTFSKTTMADSMSSLDWNKNGSLLGALTKDKNANVIDPRKSSVTISVKAHNGGKTQKMVWVDHNYFITTGFGKGREIKLYDIRKPTDGGMKTLSIDSVSGVMYPWFDYDSGVIYIPAKGENIFQFYGFGDGDICKLNEYKCDNSCKAFAFCDKRFVNYKNNEMTKMYRYKDSNLTFMSIYIPRKAGYDASLYPDTFSGVSALSEEEWMSGVDKERNVTSIANATSSTGTKVTIVRAEDKVIEDPLDVQVMKLKEINANLRKEIKEKDDINEQLRKENAELRDLLSKKGY